MEIFPSAFCINRRFGKSSLQTQINTVQLKLQFIYVGQGLAPAVKRAQTHGRSRTPAPTVVIWIFAVFAHNKPVLVGKRPMCCSVRRNRQKADTVLSYGSAFLILSLNFPKTALLLTSFTCIRLCSIDRRNKNFSYFSAITFQLLICSLTHKLRASKKL